MVSKQHPPFVYGMKEGNRMVLNSRDQFRIGDRVLLDKFYGATIKHFGPVDFAPGIWAGLLLDEPKGKNDGSVKGKRYFESPPKHGIFTLQSRISRQPEYKPGDRVVVQKQYVGTVRFVGDTHIGPGQWIGVELRNAVGHNDGSRDGNRYFMCEPQHGIFTRARNVDPALSASDSSPKMLTDAILAQNLLTVSLGSRPRDGTETEHDLERLVTENASLRKQVTSLQQELEVERKLRTEISVAKDQTPPSSATETSASSSTHAAEITELKRQLAEAQQRGDDLALQLESARSVARDAMSFQDQTYQQLTKARQRMTAACERIDDLAIAIDAREAEKEEYQELFQDTSDRLAAVQMDMLDARAEFMEQLTETDALRADNERLRELLAEHGVDADVHLRQYIDPLANVEALLAKCNASPAARAAASRLSSVREHDGRLVLQGAEDLASVAQQLEDAYQSRAGSPPTQDTSLAETRQDSLEALGEVGVEVEVKGGGDDDAVQGAVLVGADADEDDGAGEGGRRPTPPPGMDPDNFCEICEEYGHTAEECDDTITF